MGTDGGEGMVGVAYASDQVEAEMIQGLLEGAGIRSAVQQLGVNGPLVGIGLLNPGGGSRRVMVRADEAKAAEAVLGETLVEGAQGDWVDSSDAVHAGKAHGRKPRGYNLIGAYVRIWLWSLAALGLVFAVFILLRSL